MVTKYRSAGDKVFVAVINVIMVVLAVAFLYPLWQTLVLSFSASEYANSLGLKLWPSKISLSSYVYVFQTRDIYVAYYNTLFRTVVGTALAVFVTYCGGYALAQKGLPFRNVFTVFIVFTMFFSGGLIPSYINIRNLNLLNTKMALILPLLTSAWNLIIARNFISALPKELEEAATVDGAHPLRVVFTIMLPLSMPIIAVLALWNAVGHWNAWFDAMIYCGSSDQIVLQLILRRLLSSGNENTLITQASIAELTSTSVKAATIVVSVVPILCFYPFLQKYFVKGVMVGAVKG